MHILLIFVLFFAFSIFAVASSDSAVKREGKKENSNKEGGERKKEGKSEGASTSKAKAGSVAKLRGTLRRGGKG